MVRLPEEHKCFLCMGLLFPPVVLPCNHRVCEECYRSIEKHSNMECPLCRRRLHNWSRRLRGKVVSKDLKCQIEDTYPALCRKLLGQTTSSKTLSAANPSSSSASSSSCLLPSTSPGTMDASGNDNDDDDDDDDDDEHVVHRILSKPGEVKAEYQAALEKINAQKREEERQSMELIKELAEKEQDADVQAQLHQMELLKADEALARRLSEEFSNTSAKDGSSVVSIDTQGDHSSSPVTHTRSHDTSATSSNMTSSPAISSKSGKRQSGEAILNSHGSPSSLPANTSRSRAIMDSTFRTASQPLKSDEDNPYKRKKTWDDTIARPISHQEELNRAAVAVAREVKQAKKERAAKMKRPIMKYFGKSKDSPRTNKEQSMETKQSSKSNGDSTPHDPTLTPISPTTPSSSSSSSSSTSTSSTSLRRHDSISDTSSKHDQSRGEASMRNRDSSKAVSGTKETKVHTQVAAEKEKEKDRKKRKDMFTTCPLCFKKVHNDAIHPHAANCAGAQK